MINFEEIKNIDLSFAIQIFFSITIVFFIIKSYIIQNKKSDSSKHILLWLTIFMCLIIGYAFRFDLESFKHKILSVIIPNYTWYNEQGDFIIARSNDGHFYISATTPSNKKIKFLIDTGASDIALKQEDALKLGLNISNLKYNKRYSTANGIAYAAPVIIKQITISNKLFYNLSAHIISGNSDISLLGMSFIEKFSTVKINNDLLILSH